MSGAYYNEIDPYAAEWLRNLIKAGHIADGVVDERSIEDVRPDDVRGFTQCHFFAGIGVWSAALREAGWDDTRPVWTGSCPCQPFSAAGKGVGFDDERHLWPAFHHLISECRPAIVLGEQVASSDALEWIDLVQTDLEATTYAFGTILAPAAGFGMEWEGSQSDRWLRRAILHCPDALVAELLHDFADWACGNLNEGAWHIRQRTHWLGVALGDTAIPGWGFGGQFEFSAGDLDQARQPNWMGNSTDHQQWPRGGIGSEIPSQSGGVVEHRRHGGVGGVVDATNGQLSQPVRGPQGRNGQRPDSAHLDGSTRRPGKDHNRRDTVDWLFCRDEQWRPVRSGTFPLVNGATARMGQLRAYGNAIEYRQTAHFIMAADDAARSLRVNAA